jgi:two-component system OmpR family sensor kinase
MLKPFRTLRLKLTLLYVVIFGVLQAALWIAIDSTRARLVYRRFDVVLKERAQGILHSITTIESQRGPSLGRSGLDTIIRPLEDPDIYFQIRDPDGNLLASSSNAENVPLPFDAQSRAARETGGPEFLTFDGKLSRQLGLPGRRLREVTLYGGPPGHEFYLQLASSMGALDRELTNIRDLLFVFAFVSLVVAAITSWYMARRSLAPLLAIARQAREISARRLDQRIPVPSSGDEVAEMIIVLNDMLDRLEAEFAAQRRFIADVTHELKTPLAVLLGETQAVQRQGAAGDLAAYVATVNEETRRILRLVEAFLVLNRLQAGAPTPSLDRVSMEEVVLSAIRKCRTAATHRDVHLLASFPTGGEAEPIVIGDSDMLVSALQNLIENAIAASPTGGTAEIAVEISDGKVSTAVRDRGPGISEERLAQVFRLFDQPEKEHTGKPGIGLTIVRAVAELHRGALEGHSRPGGGYEFTIRLPLAGVSHNHH